MEGMPDHWTFNMVTEVTIIGLAGIGGLFVFYDLNRRIRTLPWYHKAGVLLFDALFLFAAGRVLLGH